VRRLLPVLLLLTACSTFSSSSSDAQSTPRSLAALVIQYLPVSATKAYDAHLPGKVAATVAFGKASPPDQITVSVEKIDPSEADLRRKICVLCDITEIDKDTTLQVSRGDRLPGVGLGRTMYANISLIKHDEIATLVYQGQAIRVSGKAKGNRLDVEALIDIVKDPSLGVATVKGLVDDGNALTIWSAN
jgi:hypothetical protein